MYSVPCYNLGESLPGSFWNPLQPPGKVSEREIRHEGPNTAMIFEDLCPLIYETGEITVPTSHLCGED